MKKAFSFIIRTGVLEASTWLLALLYLAITTPAHDVHFTACPLNALGFSYCPGCGLGRSITWLFHGHLQESFQMHWLGIPATILLAWRIFYLFRRIVNQNQITT